MQNISATSTNSDITSNESNVSKRFELIEECIEKPEQVALQQFETLVQQKQLGTLISPEQELEWYYEEIQSMLQDLNEKLAKTKLLMTNWKKREALLKQQQAQAFGHQILAPLGANPSSVSLPPDVVQYLLMVHQQHQQYQQILPMLLQQQQPLVPQMSALLQQIAAPPQTPFMQQQQQQPTSHFQFMGQAPPVNTVPNNQPIPGTLLASSVPYTPVAPVQGGNPTATTVTQPAALNPSKQVHSSQIEEDDERTDSSDEE